MKDYLVISTYNYKITLFKSNHRNKPNTIEVIMSVDYYDKFDFVSKNTIDNVIDILCCNQAFDHLLTMINEVDTIQPKLTIQHETIKLLITCKNLVLGDKLFKYLNAKFGENLKTKELK